MKRVIVLVLMAMILPSVSAYCGSVALPHFLYGKLTIDGEPAPVGTEMYAFVNGSVWGSCDIPAPTVESYYTTSLEGYYGRNDTDEKFAVSGTTLDNGYSGCPDYAKIFFYVKANGNWEYVTSTDFWCFAVDRLDLNVITQELPPVEPPVNDTVESNCSISDGEECDSCEILSTIINEFFDGKCDSTIASLCYSNVITNYPDEWDRLNDDYTCTEPEPVINDTVECKNECELGHINCAVAAYRWCVIDDQGCMKWSQDIEECWYGYYCVNNECVKYCENQCSPDTQWCVNNETYRNCITDNDGCEIISDLHYCNDGGICLDGSCINVTITPDNTTIINDTIDINETTPINETPIINETEPVTNETVEPPINETVEPPVNETTEPPINETVVNETDIEEPSFTVLQQSIDENVYIAKRSRGHGIGFANPRIPIILYLKKGIEYITYFNFNGTKGFYTITITDINTEPEYAIIDFTPTNTTLAFNKHVFMFQDLNRDGYYDLAIRVREYYDNLLKVEFWVGRKKI